ncbi:MAG: hypothetical protein NTX03_12605 [Bacteroidetes bacterium]|nr:hypothetical protein [Bacteroidota bacterium]
MKFNHRKYLPLGLLLLLTIFSGTQLKAATVLADAGFFGIPTPFAIILLIVLMLILVAVAVSVFSARKQIDRIMWERERPSEPFPSHTSAFGMWWSGQVKFWTTYANRAFVVMGIVAILAGYGIYDMYKKAQDLGNQIGYSPEQPIRFNHKIHAGQYQIDCRYCHTGVEKGKQANIPSLNICMNCHKGVQEGQQYGSSEIAKVVSYYNANKPVKWVRVHNLPDHVYFNHSQHVVAGKVKCEQCHGKVAEMERVVQNATLEMGWCVNCHRETKVNKTNPYYTATYDFIKKHKEDKTKFTVAQLGGLECAKCHY